MIDLEMYMQLDARSSVSPDSNKLFKNNPHTKVDERFYLFIYSFILKSSSTRKLGLWQMDSTDETKGQSDPQWASFVRLIWSFNFLRLN